LLDVDLDWLDDVVELQLGLRVAELPGQNQGDASADLK